MKQGTWGAIQPNYDNPLVLSIKSKLGNFNYDPAPKKDTIKRAYKDLITLENGAKYEGEWDLSANVRDGKG